ncbi:hypothetical protein QBC32DRAFT_84606 [Pseudoneurospora amorphoporcata]|uniref:Uncharacterized protein n=1 Tax=Pseudoneurospora amorphoporcata TaxID=241081 RepID=A0AAN6NYK2_9PEZI|nr:hypothetical protein QBC32DRAFT_84606 [Pseudoneurospora amorphoporcata]
MEDVAIGGIIWAFSVLGLAGELCGLVANGKDKVSKIRRGKNEKKMVQLQKKEKKRKRRAWLTPKVAKSSEFCSIVLQAVIMACKFNAHCFLLVSQAQAAAVHPNAPRARSEKVQAISDIAMSAAPMKETRTV